MLMYTYPPKLDKREQALKAARDIEEHKKMQRNMYKNITLALVITAMGFIVPLVIFKVILWLIGAGNLITAVLLYNVYAISRSDECYTRIFDDHLEHCQISLIRKIKTEIVLEYKDIERSQQDSRGRLIVYLKDGAKPDVNFSKNYKYMQSELDEGRLVIDFQDSKTKLFLLENLHEQIKYPKKNYNVIEDDDEDEHENIFGL